MSRLKGSYTVEGTIIISLCFIFFGMAVAISYKQFEEIIEYVRYEEEEFDVVNTFRIREGVRGILHSIED